MIYGIFIGIVLIVCGIVSAWIPWYATTALGLTAIFVILMFWTISERKTRYKPLQTKVVPTAPASGATPTATQPTTTPATTPTAPKNARSFPWSFAVIAVLIVALGWMIYFVLERQTITSGSRARVGQPVPATFAPLAPAYQPKNITGLSGHWSVCFNPNDPQTRICEEGEISNDKFTEGRINLTLKSLSEVSSNHGSGNLRWVDPGKFALGEVDGKSISLMKKYR